MKFPNIKLNRDSLGRFANGRDMAIKWYLKFGLIACLVMGTLNWGLVSINSFFSKWELQRPVVVNFEAYVRDWKTPRQPLIVVSPIAKEVTEPVDENLTDVEKLILKVFGERDFKIARAIAKAESGLRETAFNANTNGSIDVGVFQINSIHFTKQGCSLQEVVHAESNIKCAKQIYDAQGWSPWVVFQTGAFRGTL